MNIVNDAKAQVPFMTDERLEECRQSIPKYYLRALAGGGHEEYLKQVQETCREVFKIVNEEINRRNDERQE